MATHASYENWSYHNGYGNGYGPGIHGHFMDGVTYPGYYPFYQNQSELNNYETNPFLPSDCSDCIFISGLPKTIQKDEIISIFSKAGKIKFTKYGTQRIFLFLDRGTKKPTGDATVTYESPESAKNAIERFDQMNFNGHGIISVKQALPDQKNPFAEKLRRQREAYLAWYTYELRRNLQTRLQYPYVQFVPDLTRRFSALDSRLSYSQSPTEVITPDPEANDETKN